MPQVRAEVWIPVDRETCFAVSQTTGEARRRWDPFIRHQHHLDGASAAGPGVRTLTKARLGPTMVSRYVSYRPPVSVGMTMESGPWFFARFGGGWRFEAETRDGVEGTLARWKYTFGVRPAWLAPVGDRVGTWLLGREIRARIAAFARACEVSDIDPSAE